MATELRPASMRDVEALANVHAAAYRGAFVDRFSEEDMTSAIKLRCSAASWTRHISCQTESGTQIITAQSDGFVVGFVHYGRSDDDRPEAEIHRIFVTPEYWGSGVAGALLDAACVSLRSDGYTGVALWSANTRQAERFYEKAGFGKSGAQKEVELAPGVATQNSEFIKVL